MEIYGNVNSVESMGLVDGPGIRYVVFMQGCNLRCKYCHNPETWDKSRKCEKITPRALIDKVKRFKSYYGKDGGVTFSGGEPLLQPQFLVECLKLCKANSINTALDTAGVGLGKYDEILPLVDLVILDIKAVDEKDYQELTGKPMEYFNKFLEDCQKYHKKIWLRQVIVPNLNDSEENINQLAKFISKISNVKKVELLPYKTIGVHKYLDLGLNYRLDGVPDMDENRCKSLEIKLLEKINNSRI